MSRRRSDQELKTLALDLFKGNIYSDRHIHKSKLEQDLPLVFMPLALMNEKEHKAFVKEEPYFIYEYLDKAGPRSINGMPMFMSLRSLNKADSDRMFEFYEELKKQEEEFMASNGSKQEADGSPKVSNRGKRKKY